MNRAYKDVFEEYNLPLETYFIDANYKEYESHNNLEIIWVLKGNATLTVEDKTYHMHDQTVFLVYHNQKHLLQAEKNAIIIAFRLKNDYLHRRGLFFEKIPYKGEVLTFSYLADKYRQVPLLLIQFLKLILSTENPEMIYYKIIAYYNYYIEEVYNMLLKERYLDIKKQDYNDYFKRLKIIIDYIFKNYQKKITLNDLRRVIKLSPSRLSHFIKESFGVSFQDFLQNVRYEHALFLLKTSKFSIHEIAKISGFSDQKYLNNLMKKHLKMTCLRYRSMQIENMMQISRTKKINTAFVRQIENCLRELKSSHHFRDLFEIEPVYRCIY